MEKFARHNGSIFTLDTLEALKKAEKSLQDRHGSLVKLSFRGSTVSSWKDISQSPGPTGMPPHASMKGTGREVYAILESELFGKESESTLRELWSAMVPLGFMPWNRYPVLTPTSHVFHFFGKWGAMGDSLQGEGRGDHSWPSMCVASQLEVGTWEGNRTTERSIQAHMHRLGIPCGPLDGIIGDRTISVINSLKLSGLNSTELEQKLSSMELQPPPKKREKRFGQLFMDGTEMRVFSSGSVSSRKTRTGHVLSAWGPGVFNVVLD